MIYKSSKFVISMLLTFVATTSVSYAEITTWDFTYKGANSDIKSTGAHFGNQLYIDSDKDGSADLTIEAWSDTGCRWSCIHNNWLEQGLASANSNGLLNYNKQTEGGGLRGEDHYIDNVGIDGKGVKRSGEDVDMMLFSFTESSALTGINLGEVGMITGFSIAAFDTLPVFNQRSWSGIVGQSIFAASYEAMNAGPFALVNKIDDQVVEAKYWIIGAYNEAFGTVPWGYEKPTALKIASITTEYSKGSTPSPRPVGVAEPSTVAMFASFGLFLMWRRKKTA